MSEKGFDSAYADTRDLFGGEPESTLVRFADMLDPERPVLDIGAGQGRNSRWLARRGLAVHAMEPAKRTLEQLSSEPGIKGFACTFETFEANDETYGGVIVLGLTPILRRPAIVRLVTALCC